MNAPSFQAPMPTMEERRIRRTPHAVYQITYHFVWIPRYRKIVLRGQIAERLNQLLYTIADQHEFEVLALEVLPDHVHLFVSAPPTYALAQKVEYVDSRSTSQRYVACGHIAKENRRSQSVFLCAACEHTALADVNAAIVSDAPTTNVAITYRGLTDCNLPHLHA